MECSKQNLMCRLCLMKLSENCEPIDEMVQCTLSFVNFCPNLAVSDDPMMCETCAANLKNCFDFKARCLSVEDCIASFAEYEDKKVDLRDIYSKVKLDGNIGRIPNDHNICRFCLELVKDNASTSVKHDVDLIAILEKYFLEMDVRLTDGIIACVPCHNSLRFHANLLNNFLRIEGKLNEYYKVEGANYKNKVDLRDAATFVSKSLLNVENISSLMIKDENIVNTSVKNVIKVENIANTNVDIKVKFEDPIDVKEEMEQSVDSESQSNDDSMDVEDMLATSTIIAPLKKRSQLNIGHLTLTEKQIIINMYKAALDEEPKMKISKIVYRIATAVGVAKSTVYRTIKEYKHTGTIANPKHGGGRPSIVTALDEATKKAVQQIVDDLFSKNEVPTLDKIHTEIKNRPDLPGMSRSSLYKFMKKINFKYVKRDVKSVSKT